MAEVDSVLVKDANGNEVEVPTLLSLEALVGEVQATPTANTVLARLKAQADTLTSILTKILTAPATEAKQDDIITALGGDFAQRSVSPTVSAGAYSVNDVLGSKMEIANAARSSGGSGMIQGVSMFDEGAAAIAGTIDVLFFSDDPDSSTFTDNGALAVVDADGPKLVQAVTLDQIFDTGDGKLLQASGLSIPYQLTATSLYAVAVHRGTWAPDATDGVTFNFQLMRT